MPQEAIEKIWAKFDKDKSGTIELKEFLHELIYGVADKEQKTMLTTEKTTRCLTALKAAIRYYGVKQEEIMSLFDKNKDGKINIAEFSDLVIAIDKKLPEDEIKMMFEYLDSDRSGLVSVQELRPILF
jgi:Ca2+-binding EF-hand superfamily protein